MPAKEQQINKKLREELRELNKESKNFYGLTSCLSLYTDNYKINLFFSNTNIIPNDDLNLNIAIVIVEVSWQIELYF